MPTTAEFLTFWGKAQPSGNAVAPFHPIAYHLLDVAAVADAILEVRPLARARAGRLFGLEPEQAHRLLVALVALHDLGKFALAFQAKAPAHWPAVLGAYDPTRIVDGRHTDDGYVLWHWTLRRLVAERVWPEGATVLRVLAPAVFGHHGRPVGGPPPTLLPAQRFGATGTSVAVACAETVLSLLAPSPIEAPEPDERAACLASWWVAGLVTVADWIGSRQEWFEYADRRDDDPTLAHYWETARHTARRAVRAAGLVAPPPGAARTFGELTGLDLPPSPAQRWAETVALQAGPLLVVLEDVTGAGKTEAAQMLVHRLMVAGRASGAYWAMPTQATANAMYERQARALDALYAADADPRPSLVLAHGQQRLHERFRSRVLGVEPGHELSAAAVTRRGDDDELSGTVSCAAFLADNRRAALLADVGAGTVDQAILGVLPSKFNAMRLFGLADKVLVVDEAHAYDAYVSGEVQALLRFQAALGGSAIVLSATLSRKQREELARAWHEGLGGEGRFSRNGGAAAPLVSHDAYPLATMVSADGVREDPVDAAPRSRRSVTVRLVHQLDDALDHVLDAAHAGAAVAWVRNTVDDCLAAAALLRARGIEPIVFHARFAQADRQRREQEVLGRFGKEAPHTERTGRVLVATQVIEQSLDLDFDAMVSDVAPVDLLVQRAGRLQRHEARKDERPARLKCELVVLSPMPDEEPPREWLAGIFKGTSHVYENAGVLWRTVRVLASVGAISTPGGLRDLVESVYGSSDVPSLLLPVAQRAEGEERGNAATARYATLKVTDGYHAGAQAWLSELRVPTRLENQPSIVVRLAKVRLDGSLTPWASDERPVWKAWALSEVRVSAKRVPPGCAPEARYEGAVAAARMEWGRFEQELPLLPLEQVVNGVWRGRLIHPRKRTVLTIRYTAAEGLAFEKIGAD
ncbi:MAG: CRISPR-associated helicase Cas3' [Gemmatimonadaceae bacterium]